MTASRDPDRLIAAYLDDGPVELARDSYAAVDESVRRTKQRTLIGPRRTRPMPNFARAVLGAAAVVVAAVIGLSVLRPAPSTGPGGATSPTPARSATVGSSSSSVEPSASPPVYRWPSNLSPGTYTTSFAWDPGLQFTFTIPAGWKALDINIAKNDRVSLAFFPVADVAGPTCASPAPSRPAVWTADTVLTALGTLVPFDAAPVDARVGVRDARYVEFSAKPPIGCRAADNLLFRLPEPTCPPGVCGGVGPATFGLEFGTVVHHERLWLMNVGRSVVAMDAVWTDGATPAELAELQSVIDSVRFETPLATPAPQASGG